MKKINFEDGVTKGNATTFNQMQTNIENEINGIVESGSNENGSWTKWADGTMECNNHINITNLSVSSSWGGIYFGNTLNSSNTQWVQPFIDKPKVSLTIDDNGASSYAFPVSVGSVEPTYFRRITIGKGSSGSWSGTIHIRAIGRWK